MVDVCGMTCGILVIVSDTDEGTVTKSATKIVVAFSVGPKQWLLFRLAARLVSLWLSRLLRQSYAATIDQTKNATTVLVVLLVTTPSSVSLTILRIPQVIPQLNQHIHE